MSIRTEPTFDTLDYYMMGTASRGRSFYMTCKDYHYYDSPDPVDDGFGDYTPSCIPEEYKRKVLRAKRIKRTKHQKLLKKQVKAKQLKK